MYTENLPNIDNIVLRAEVAKESIAMCYDGNMWQLSCRSIDEINSQVLMEKLGRGGHRCSAGATIKEAIGRCKKYIKSCN